MSSSTTRIPAVRAEAVTVTEDALTVELSAGRSISVPLACTHASCMGRPRSARTGA